MFTLERDLRRLSGVATAGELLALGHEAELVKMLHRAGRIVRVSKGVYALPIVPAEIRRAWAAGGRLGCLSALA